ncbi:MAG TPA: hypothetical protein VFU14_20195 [Acidimicrobiales bacterium]|nr:hypothetical protein [Acidimicrobiales bacterium]
MAFGSASERLAFILDLDAQGAIAGFRQVGATAERELGKADSRLDRLGGRMQTVGAGMVTAAGVAGVALYGLGRTAGDLEQAVGGTEAVFGSAAGAIDEFAGRSAQAMGLSERAFREATTSIGGNLKRMGFDAGAAAEQSIELTQVAADLAATYGGTTAEAVAALGAAFRGEADPAERFNLNLKAGAVSAKAVEMGLAESTASVDEHARAQALLALIMEQSADAQGQFARESDTAAGSMQIAAAEGENMRASLGEAVAPVIADVSGKLAEFAGWVQGANEATDGGVGKFLAYGTAAVGVAGALSFVGGAAMRLIDNLAPIGPAGDRSLTRLGKAATAAGGALAAAGIVLTLKDMADASTRLSIDVDELNQRLAENEDAALTALAAAAEIGGGWDEVASQMVDQSVPAAERLIEALERQAAAGVDVGDSIEVLRAAVEDKRAADAQGQVDQEAYTQSVDEAAEALGGQADATKDATDAQEEFADAVEEASDAVRDSLGLNLDLQSAMLDAAGQVEEYNRVIADGESTDRDRQQAGIDLLESFLAVGEAAKESAEAEATASGRARSATEEGTAAQIAALRGVADTLAPGSPLRAQLDAYIRDIEDLDRTVTTVLRIEQQGQVPTGWNSFAKGGGARDVIVDPVQAALAANQDFHEAVWRAADSAVGRNVVAGIVDKDPAEQARRRAEALEGLGELYQGAVAELGRTNADALFGQNVDEATLRRMIDAAVEADRSNDQIRADQRAGQLDAARDADRARQEAEREAEREAEEAARERTTQRRERLDRQRVQFEVGDLSKEDYVSALKRELARIEAAGGKYSSDWYSVWRELQRIDPPAAEAAAATSSTSSGADTRQAPPVSSGGTASAVPAAGSDVFVKMLAELRKITANTAGEQFPGQAMRAARATSRAKGG